jgi:hypothetical protein
VRECWRGCETTAPVEPLFKAAGDLDAEVSGIAVQVQGPDGGGGEAFCRACAARNGSSSAEGALRYLIMHLDDPLWQLGIQYLFMHP